MTPVYLVRHAKALDRSTWTEPDRLRPLSKAGRRQAEALPVHFAGIPFQRIVSSPFVRCVQTFEPLAKSLGASVEHAEELVEGGPGRDALAVVLGLATSGAVAACTHGDVLLDALVTLRAAEIPLRGPFECKKGSTWVLEVEEGAVRSARYVQPPAIGGATS